LSSTDGSDWAEVDREPIDLPLDQPLLVGVAACGADSGDATRPFTPLQARLSGLAIVPLAGGFRRGDANVDGTVNIADAVFTLSYLFALGTVPSCLDAADANDDGERNIADAIAILSHLFADAGPLPAPFGACGIDPTIDEADCASYPPCAQ